MMSKNHGEDAPRLTASNEFASVILTPVDGVEGTMIRVEDARTGASVVLDPLELESLTRLARHDFKVLANPSFHGFNEFGEIDEGRDALELVPGEGEIEIPS